MFVILVHPGSLIAAKSEVGFNDWSEMEEELSEVPPENRFLISGGLIPHEEYSRPNNLACLANAHNPEIIAEPFGEDLQKAAHQIWNQIPPEKREAPILVTGAWADPHDGCATEILKTLVSLGANAQISPYSPIYE